MSVFTKGFYDALVRLKQLEDRPVVRVTRTVATSAKARRQFARAFANSIKKGTFTGCDSLTQIKAETLERLRKNLIAFSKTSTRKPKKKVARRRKK